MVALRWKFLGLFLIFGRIHPTASTITLSTFQPVTGFSEACTNTYNTPLSACSASDFKNGQPCSKSCIQFLDDLTATIHKACQGTKAYPDTLMGMFFISEGTTAICPNARGSTGSNAADGIDTQPTITITSISNPSDVPESTKDRSAEIPEATISEPTAVSSPVVPVHSASSDSPGLPGAASATFTTSVTPLDPVATSVTTIPLSALTAASTSIAVIAETTETPPKPQAKNGGGGGTPFDITSSSHRNLRPMTLGASAMVSFAILTWLV